MEAGEEMAKFVVEVGDQLMAWFLRNMIASRIYDLDNPGFIIERLSGKTKESYRRQFFFPEEVLAEIETRFVTKYGEQAHLSLYAAGKKFGYSYASVLHFPNMRDNSTTEVNIFSRMLIQYVAVQWATKAELLICNLQTKEFKVRFWDYAVCRKSGIGHVLGDGGISGIWAYMMNTPTLEGIQTTCQGKNEGFCEFYVAPKAKLQSNKINTCAAVCDADAIENEMEYMEINKIRPTVYARNSMRELIDVGFFKYANKKILFQDSPHFSLEISIFYILEKELSKLKRGRDLLFDICFKYGKRISASYLKTKESITDYLSALGFGDIILKGNAKTMEIVANNFPWTDFSEKSDFTLFRGLASGIVSGCVGRNVVFSIIKSERVGTEFSIHLSEAKK